MNRESFNLVCTSNSPRVVAIEFLRTYVERGDPIEHLQSSSMGAYGDEYLFEILPRGKVRAIAQRRTAQEREAVFSLRALYDELASGAVQQELI